MSLAFHRTKQEIVGVDLFCGLGGLTHGLARSGVRVLAGVDLDPVCRYAYERNNDTPFVHRDIRYLTAGDLDEIFGDCRPRLLAGCAPCQPFSTYSRAGRNRRPDRMWNLLAEFGRLVRETQPEFVTMENVPELARHLVFESFLADLAGYSIFHSVIECVRYGIPQTRKRLVLVASRLGRIGLGEPDPSTPRPTVRGAIGGLPRLNAGQADEEDALHAACRLSAINLKRIRASKPGGTWRDWDHSLLATCHRKGSGATFPSVYGRMEWDLPSPTITTQCFGYGNGRFGHPDQDRAITLREAAILQTFPASYRVLPDAERFSYAVMGRLIGNAVPVRLAEVIGECFVRHAAELAFH